jgi:hypothetical protein
MLTNLQRAAMRVVQAQGLTELASIWRAPAATSGKIAPLVQVAADVACRRWPAAQGTPRAAAILAAFVDLAATRIDAIVIFLDTVDVRTGDEVRIGSTRYVVERSAQWTTIRACAVREIVP